MTRIVITLSLAAWLGFACPHTFASDQNALQGEWYVVSVESGGKKREKGAADAAIKQTWVIKGKSITVQTADPNQISHIQSFAVRPDKSPKEIDINPFPVGLFFETDIIKGIYTLEGDEWKVCLPAVPLTVPGKKGADRPKEMPTKEGGTTAVISLQRKKSMLEPPKAATAGPQLLPGGFRLTVELRDGSCLIGEAIEVKDLALQTSFGKATVPIGQIESIQFPNGNGPATVNFRNGDRLTGQINPAEWGDVKLSTVVGEIKAPASQICLCRFEPAPRKAKISARASSSWEPNTSPDRAFDGNTDTYWNSGGYAPAWIEADLGAATPLASILLVPPRTSPAARLMKCGCATNRSATTAAMQNWSTRSRVKPPTEASSSWSPQKTSPPATCKSAPLNRRPGSPGGRSIFACADPHARPCPARLAPAER
jgi:uncharacterized protein (TIGR03067 family)